MWMGSTKANKADYATNFALLLAWIESSQGSQVLGFSLDIRSWLVCCFKLFCMFKKKWSKASNNDFNFFSEIA